MAELILVRHAQASFDAEDYDRLSPLGECQSRWLGESFESLGMRFDACVTGTLRRHTQTLDGILAAGQSDAPAAPRIAPGLDEYDFRALVRAFEQLEPQHPLVKARRSAPADKPAFYRVLRLALRAWASQTLPGPLSDTWPGFQARVEEAAAQLQALAATHQRILAVGSGGAIATLLGGRLGLDAERIVDLNMQIRNTSVSRFYLNRSSFLLASWNATPHLEVRGRLDAITYG